RLGLQVLEEREPHREPAVLGGVVPGALEQLAKERFALLGDPVDVLPPADLLLGEDHLHRALALQSSQGGIERSVRHLPEAPQRVRQVLLELVAVHRALLEEPQDGQFEHRGCSFLRIVVARIWRRDISAVYIETIYGGRPSVNQPSGRGGPRRGAAPPGSTPGRARPPAAPR